MHADLLLGACADNAFPPVTNHFIQLGLSYVRQDFSQRGGGAAGGVPFHAVMHFDDFEIEFRTQDLGCLACQPEQGVDAGGIVGGPHQRDLLAAGEDRLSIGFRVSSRADDQRFLGGSAKFRKSTGGFVKTEINDRIRLIQNGSQVVIHVDLSYNIQSGVRFRTTN